MVVWVDEGRERAAEAWPIARARQSLATNSELEVLEAPRGGL